MSRPGQTDYGKGSYNSVSKKFWDHFDEIDQGGYIIKYNEDGIGGEGYYIFYTKTKEVDGPFNTYSLAHKNLSI